MTGFLSMFDGYLITEYDRATRRERLFGPYETAQDAERDAERLRQSHAGEQDLGYRASGGRWSVDVVGIDRWR